MINTGTDFQCPTSPEEANARQSLVIKRLTCTRSNIQSLARYIQDLYPLPPQYLTNDGYQTLGFFTSSFFKKHLSVLHCSPAPSIMNPVIMLSTAQRQAQPCSQAVIPPDPTSPYFLVSQLTPLVVSCLDLDGVEKCCPKSLHAVENLAYLQALFKLFHAF